MENIIEFIANIEDSRQQAKIRYTVTEIIIIVLFAMLGDANEWEEIEAFAKNEPLSRDEGEKLKRLSILMEKPCAIVETGITSRITGFVRGANV